VFSSLRKGEEGVPKPRREREKGEKRLKSIRKREKKEKGSSTRSLLRGKKGEGGLGRSEFLTYIDPEKRKGKKKKGEKDGLTKRKKGREDNT